MSQRFKMNVYSSKKSNCGHKNSISMGNLKKVTFIATARFKCRQTKWESCRAAVRSFSLRLLVYSNYQFTVWRSQHACMYVASMSACTCGQACVRVCVSVWSRYVTMHPDMCGSSESISRRRGRRGRGSIADWKVDIVHTWILRFYSSLKLLSLFRKTAWRLDIIELDQATHT